MNLVKRSIHSISWNILASLTIMILGLVRSIFLARLLPVEVFGVYAFSASIVLLTLVVPNFGMAGAFIHQTEETQDEGRAGAVHFTLILIFTFIWAVFLASVSILFFDKEIIIPVLVLILTFSGMQLTQTSRTILIKRVQHKRLAIIQMINVLIATIVSISMVFMGFTIWALLAVDIVSFLVLFSGLYGYKPVFLPTLNLDRAIAKYFLQFGCRNFLNNLLQEALGRADKLWIGIFLGKTQLGFYSRAFRFATYPNILFSSSVTTVIDGTFAHLKNDPEKLSKLFFATNSILIRAGIFVSGVFFVAAPEVVVMVIGSKWLPMLNTFRLLLIFTLFDPLRLTIASLYIAMGKPGYIVSARIFQLVVFLVFMFIFGSYSGIIGVAVAMNLMLFSGLIILFHKAKQFVEFSGLKMVFPPVLAGLAGFFLVFLLNNFFIGSQSDLFIVMLKIICFMAGYILVICLIEFKFLLNLVNVIYTYKNPS